jgi:hypothetical protein
MKSCRMMPKTSNMQSWSANKRRLRHRDWASKSVLNLNEFSIMGNVRNPPPTKTLLLERMKR